MTSTDSSAIASGSIEDSALLTPAKAASSTISSLPELRRCRFRAQPACARARFGDRQSAAPWPCPACSVSSRAPIFDAHLQIRAA